MNDLPGMVTAISRRGGDAAALETESLAFPNAGLEDHWLRKEALARIEAGRFDFVVLQQGPSSLPESRADLVAWTKRFGERIRAAGAEPALYMVWPAATRAGDRPRVAASYAAAARAIEGLLLPAGEAWWIALDREPRLELYGVDRFHPAPLGTFLAALVVEAMLTGRAPYDQPAELRLGSEALIVDAATARRLATAAAEAIADRSATERPRQR